MKVLYPPLGKLAASFAIAIACVFSAVAQSPAAPKGIYTVLPPHPAPDGFQTSISSPPLQTWNGFYVYNGKTYYYNMVGAAPSKNVSVTVPVYIIPIKIVVTNAGKQYSYDPAHILSNGDSVTENTVESPLFTYSIDYKLGTVDVGTTQYIDAYQRANFWGTVRNHTNSHLLLSAPHVLPRRTLTVPARYGTTGSPYGFTTGLVDINYFDAQLPGILAAEGIQPNELAIFLTYDVYLTQAGNCCIGGYHSAEGSASNLQSYMEATYVDHRYFFAQDVSALSHEIGEWVDDPLTVKPNGNQTPCGMLENGDPLEGAAKFGDFPYLQGGFTFHLQDLAMLPYFGAPRSTSANGWFSFHNASLQVCSSGP